MCLLTVRVTFFIIPFPGNSYFISVVLEIFVTNILRILVSLSLLLFYRLVS